MILIVRYKYFLSLFLCVICCAQISYVCAEVPDDSFPRHNSGITYAQRLSLARDFVARLKTGIDRADMNPGLNNFETSKKSIVKNILPEGEMLIFQPILEKGFRLKGMIIGQMHHGEVVLSLRDFVDILQLAINIEQDGQKASGWYIREDRPFSLDMVQKVVNTTKGDFDISDNVFTKDGDVYVPVDELSRWFGFDIDAEVDSQEFVLTADIMLPVQEKEERKRNKYTRSKTFEPTLPLGGEANTMVGIPVVDVSTNSTYNKSRNDDEGEYYHRAYVTTASDFAKGTLVTKSSIDDNNQLSRVRATYKQNSLKGDLLGSLKAKRIELGDVTTTNTPIGGGISQELGMRITNTDPIRNYMRAHTVISGNAIPGWDVELYRNTQFLGLVTVGDDGFYSFDDITLYSSDNNFRLVFYGPQGEQHEETVYVPYDKDLLSRGEGIYDISVSFDGQNAYVKRDLKSSDEDRGTLNIAAMYEKTLSGGITGSVGFRSNEDNGNRDYIGSAGVSWALKEALINADLGVDDEGDATAELSVRRDFGDHEINYTNKWRQANFDGSSSFIDGGDTFNNNLSISGPFFAPHEDVSSRYSAVFAYDSVEGEDPSLSSAFGLSLGYRNANFNGRLQHETGGGLKDDQLDSIVNLSLKRGKNYLRLMSNYEITPDARLDALSASYSRDINDKIDFGLSVNKDMDQSLVGYQARLDWQAGFVSISPSVSYNSEDDFFAGLNTRFALAREPITGRIKMHDRAMTNNAFVSAFVYLDKNGDGKFNEKDEPLPEIVVSAPQNGRRAETDEKGIAFFDSMSDLRLTDVYVDQESLPDPAWIPGFEGISILPRKGYVAQVEFPIHMSGELDGTVYANVVPLPDEAVAQIEPASGVAPEEGGEEKYDIALGTYQQELAKSGGVDKPKAQGFVKAESQPVPLRNIELQLYNDKGNVEQKIITDVDGFYYFTNIPPGRYFLMISEGSAQRKNIIRPKPQPIEITYDGTLIYDHKIYVDTGEGDVPSEIMADLKAYKERHPHVHFDDEQSDLVLNLGEFNSRLLMSLVWYKLRTRYGEIFGEQTHSLVPPAQSYADAKTGKHSLRVALHDKTLDEAYSMCRSFLARDQYCKVEIYSSYMKMIADKADLAKLSEEAKEEKDVKVSKEEGLIKEEGVTATATAAPLDIANNVGVIEEVKEDEVFEVADVFVETEEEDFVEEDVIKQERFTPAGEFKNISNVSRVIVP